METRSLIVSLHDVTAGTLDRVRRQLADLARFGIERTSLLVVPCYHGHERLDQHLATGDCLRQLQAAGHEIVLHGWVHQTPPTAARCSTSLRTCFFQNWYTAGEAEFLNLDRQEAGARIGNGLAMFRELGLQAAGFIAPAWLMNAATCAAVAEHGLLYTNTISEIIHLPSGRRQGARSCVWSTRARWRRTASRAWNAMLFYRLKDVEPLRISLHPGDVEHPAVWRQITELVRRARAERSVTTYGAWVAERLCGQA